MRAIIGWHIADNCVLNLGEDFRVILPKPKTLGAEPRPPASAEKDYLFEMLWELSNIARSCNEPGIALALRTLVISHAGRKAVREFDSRITSRLDQKSP